MKLTAMVLAASALAAAPLAAQQTTPVETPAIPVVQTAGVAQEEGAASLPSLGITPAAATFLAVTAGVITAAIVVGSQDDDDGTPSTPSTPSTN